MSGIKTIGVGTIVHYFPVNDEHCSRNNAEKVPAIVVQSFGENMANISVFPMNADGPNVLRYSVHDSLTVSRNTDGTPLMSYWERIEQ